jgi:nitroimidazol reductase NimA-like FMN-containing flavoprotein (pyridoxamine 5'-phosphate oxidase superfamily)
METLQETRRSVQQLLHSQRFAVLSTGSETGPYSSLIAFWAAEDLGHLVFATMRATRKFNYLAVDPRVSLLFDNRSNSDVDIRQAMAVTATGTAAEITDGTTRTAAVADFLAKHPHLASFLASPGCALVKVTVDTYYVVTRFQNVVELHMPGFSDGS